MYRALGCKMAVGMPFKDLATADSLFLRDIPAADDTEARRALRRLAVSAAPHPVVFLSKLLCYMPCYADTPGPLVCATGLPAHGPSGCHHRPCPLPRVSTLHGTFAALCGKPTCIAVSRWLTHRMQSAPQEVGVHVISPIDALERTPLAGAVAAIALRDAQAAAEPIRWGFDGSGSPECFAFITP